MTPVVHQRARLAIGADLVREQQLITTEAYIIASATWRRCRRNGFRPHTPPVHGRTFGSIFNGEGLAHVHPTQTALYLQKDNDGVRLVPHEYAYFSLNMSVLVSAKTMRRKPTIPAVDAH